LTNQVDFTEPEEEGFEHYAFTVDPGQEPMRIDRWLMHRMAYVSRTKIQAGINAGSVYVNNKNIKSNYKVKPRDHIRIILPDEPRDTELYPENIPLDIKYEDDSVVIVNKPAGMVVHPGCNNYNGTLVNALLYHFGNLPQKNENHRPGLIHRIDKDTTGLLVIGKTEEVLSHLGKQFFEHTIERRYTALVWGEIAEDSGTITGFLARDPKDRRKSKHFDNPEDGKIAITHYKVLERFHFLTLVECQLETGRTHQIRAHFAHLGHPLFSDEMYGGRQIIKGANLPKFKQFIHNNFDLFPRQALHARVLGFTHPISSERLCFEEELPKDFTELLHRVRQYSHHML
jgi:23S rRNA pseudouridine1911/1915/1917 synthase